MTARSRAGLAGARGFLALALLLAACGVKAPPRPPEKPQPQEKPAGASPARPPAAPSPAAAPAPPAGPAAPGDRP